MSIFNIFCNHVEHFINIQALQYLRKLCNHPALVLNNKHPQYNRVVADLQNKQSSIRDMAHAPKLAALK